MTFPGLPDARASLPPAGARIGPYALQGELGRGGMGAVYRARHLELGVERALKLMHRPQDPRGLARFEREVDHLARVAHPNVVKVHDAGVHEGQPWYAMELVSGRSLQADLDEARPALERALELAQALCEGVAALHAAGVIHRDLKPGNVVLAPDGRPVVLDLGLAVAPGQDQRLTQTGVTLGTVTYMAPEQLRAAKDVTPAADVFALGLILFELLTGEPAVERGSVHAVVASICSEDRPPPSSVDPDLPARLDEVVGRATQRDPARRYQHAGELAAAIAAARQDLGPSRRARRRRAALAGLALLALGGALAGAGRAALGGDPSGRGPGALGPAVGAADASVAAEDAAARERAGELLRRRQQAEVRELARLERLAPRERAAALRAWLERHLDHPGAPEAERLLRATYLLTPKLELAVAGTWDARPTPDGQRFVVAADDRVSVHDLAGRELAGWPLPGRLRALAIDPVGSWAAVGGQLDTIYRLDLQRLELEPLCEAPASIVKALAISPDGALLAAGGTATRMILVTLATRAIQRVDGLQGGANAIAFLGGERLVTGGGIPLDRRQGRAECALRWYRLGPGGPRLEARLLLAAQVQDLAVSPAGLLAAAFDGQTVALFPQGVTTREGLRYFVQPEREVSPLSPHPAHRGVSRAVSFSPDGRRFYSAGGSDAGDPRMNEVAVWDTATTRELHRIGEFSAGFRSLVCLADGRHLLTTTPSGVQLWDLSGLAD
ncbi:MAG: WD40 repeat domain-containing serine/threonine protein kinase [Planctomycetota bacterium]